MDFNDFQNCDTSLTEKMISPPDLVDDRSTEEPKSLETIFRELLREKTVGSNASWEYALKLIGNDSRFELFRHHPERKQMFNAYKTQKAKEEREEQRFKAKRAKENLEKFLQTTEKMHSSVKYRQAVEMFRDNEYWKAVPEADRREIFEDVVVFLSNSEKLASIWSINLPVEFLTSMRSDKLKNSTFWR